PTRPSSDLNSNNGSFTAAYNACSGARHKPKTNPYDAPEQTVSITAQSAIFGNSRPDRTHATSASSSRHNEATLSSRGAVSLLAATGARMTRSQLVAQRPTPMRQEELFFTERDALEWTDDWPQVGRELQHHDDEHHVPGPQDAGAVARRGHYATGQRQSKTRAHEQHQQGQRTHEARCAGRLRGEPRDGRETDQQQTLYAHAHQERRSHVAQPTLSARQAAED